ncbi:hypothetical protein HaLaN_15064 [Haematococcus lacustris]|uniref:Uncharacterized protein n=1 Tax=Haematococcus lacustris TaxID=44745 RepID=A0A699ZA50_HAELA|nr:hypothetical protein HaLaN_15064 [Haematococcus lacustris]
MAKHWHEIRHKRLLLCAVINTYHPSYTHLCRYSRIDLKLIVHVMLQAAQLGPGHKVSLQDFAHAAAAAITLGQHGFQHL